ncbi:MULTISPECIES: pyridoxal phosphate-dependent aminotransferase [unclassified Roseitalea]|uniref:pyridoxal phosphate-dependent aminotransferase n=1 Tax=unclassified Roseitalea TaxID=2639107 RepID=UPI00273D2F87|nr:MULTISPECIES: pyridoxal phosphate-dependent aminotransferase [unclassified Roseitalea]
MPPRPNTIVAAAPDTIPFIAPERLEREAGRPFAARLGANEGNLGPSPAAIAAMEKAARDDAWKYPDPENRALREALCAHLGTAMDEIVVGPGIDGLLGLIVRIFSVAGAAIVSSRGAYPTFAYHVTGHGRRLVTAEYRDDREDLDALAALCREETARIVYVSNPDNPMGTWWDAQDVTRFFDAVPDSTLIVLDEAYGETAPEGTLPAIDTARPNLLRLRTFSKAHGLAGLRCGYALGHRALTAPFDKVRDHFGVSLLSQAGALAALGDRAYLAQTVQRIAEARERIAAIGRANGLTPLPSATNFVALDCGSEGAHAMALLDALAARGVFLRKPMVAPLDRCIRVSVGRPGELDHFEGVLAEACAAVGEGR